MVSPLWFSGAVVVVFTLVAAISDVRTKRLPNWLTVPALVCGIIFQVVTAGWAGLLTALAGFAVGFSILFVLWLIGGSGGGDVKLMGALGAWLGPAPIFIVFLMSACVVLLFTVGNFIKQIATGGFTKAKDSFLTTTAKSKRRGESEKEHLARKQKRRLLPFAVPVAVSTWVFFALKVLATLNEHAAIAAGQL